MRSILHARFVFQTLWYAWLWAELQTRDRRDVLFISSGLPSDSRTGEVSSFYDVFVTLTL